MKNYDVLNELIPKTQELHRAIFDKGYKQGKAHTLDKIRAEIEHLTITEGGEDYTRKMAELFALKIKVLNIFDKYREVSE